MLNAMHAARAYAASAAHRNPRDQEADIFRQANAALRQGLTLGKRARTRALADNERLWSTVIDLLRDPENALPEGLRASIISVGLAVQREMRTPAPNFDFLMSVNDNIAAGLSGQP
jgi:flagellar protein FlaF